MKSTRKVLLKHTDLFIVPKLTISLFPGAFLVLGCLDCSLHLDSKPLSGLSNKVRSLHLAFRDNFPRRGPTVSSTFSLWTLGGNWAFICVVV